MRVRTHSCFVPWHIVCTPKQADRWEIFNKSLLSQSINFNADLSLLLLNTFLSMIFPVFQNQTSFSPSSLSANELTSFPVRKTQGNRQENCQLFFLPYTATSALLLSEFSDLRVFLLKINPIPVFSVKQSLSAITGLITLSMSILYLPLV